MDHLKPVTFDQANKTYIAPGCGDLPVFQGADQIISCWELTDEQIQQIVDSKRIWLGVMGIGQPPIWLSSEYPFINTEEWAEDLEEKPDAP